ncbi:MAG: elongation factor G [Actinobacteria bacterium]|nr:elongation factor G [Actinomycetota bacterium]
MKKYPIDKLRNLGLVSHGGAGKTSLAEALLYNAGMIDRLGRVDDGTSTMDYDPEEIKRKISISTSIAPCEWKDHKVNIVDTPGYFDFVGEVKAALRVVEGALILADGVAGVEVGTEMVWRYAEENGLPRMIFVNKMDRENANFDKVLGEIKEAFGNSATALQIPVGAEANFKGVVDLVQMKAIIYIDATGKKFEVKDIPAELTEKAEELREKLVEAAAESDDELTLKYLEGEPLTAEEVRFGLCKGIKAGKIVPVLCGSALKNIGIQPLLDTIVECLPSPADRATVKGVNPKTKAEVERKVTENEPFSALVFKTMADPFVGKLTLFRVFSGSLKSDSQVYNASKGRTERVGQLFIPKGKAQEAVAESSAGDIAAVAKLQETGTGDSLADEANPIVFPGINFPKPVYSMAIAPKSKGDEDKIGTGLNRLKEEDPTFTVERNTSTNQTVISGLGDQHLDVICDRLRRKFGVETTLETPKVPYKETIKGSAKKQGRHKKQSGGRGQFGDVWLELQPLPEGEYEFVDKIFGGSVPLQYRPAVDKGCREIIAEGVLAGYPVTNVRVILYDGSYHTVDSSEMAFKIAAHLAFKAAFMESKPALLEPIMSVEVTVPDAYMGDVIGDLNKKRGKILGMEPQGRNQVVKALAPLAEMFNYAIDLRSFTQGRGTYTMTFDHYEEVPAHEAQKIIAEAQKNKEKEE